MEVSPGSSLYRRLCRLVILAAAALGLVHFSQAQFAKRENASKGPRALGLIQKMADGKGRLVPVCIMYDSQFYDAGAFKAAPVPMALESGNVYEVLRTGVSEGLFTVSGALRAQDPQGHAKWFGEGVWRSAAEVAAAAVKKEPAPANRPEPESGPPVLRRPGTEKAKAGDTTPAAASPSSTAPSSAASAPSASASPSASMPAPVSSPVPVEEQDPNRPRLRRGIPPPRASSMTKEEFSLDTTDGAKTTPVALPAASTVQLIPAISDANGPDPRPYGYKMKAAEEEAFRKKMLVLATAEIRARATVLEGSAIGAPAPVRRGGRTSAKAPQPVFEEVQLHVFDLSSSNEPVLVLSAKARMSGAKDADLQYGITLVARDDIYGELHKALSNVTDTRHLDVLSRFDLIDAVDADGDGRGELLFKKTTQDGSAFVVYRVIGDQLWPLFEGSPQ